jgi:hypothetical protein
MRLEVQGGQGSVMADVAATGLLHRVDVPSLDKPSSQDRHEVE